MSILKKIENRIVQNNVTILDALKKMDEEKCKLLFVFQEENFVSILTIGDIQRAVIKTANLSDSIISIIDKNKIYAFEDEPESIVMEKMYRLRAECMPVLNKNGCLVDVIFWRDKFKNSHKTSERQLALPVVIMAGGKGTRLKPITNVIPKPLIPINEKTIIETIIDQFADSGCSKFYISVNYKKEIIEYYLENLEQKLDISFLEEDKPLGTIGSVSLLKGMKIDKPFFVSNCDIIVNQDYRDVYDYHQNNRNDITIVTAIKSLNIPYGVIETGENGLMQSILEKPDMSYMINTGVYILQPELINEIPSDTFYHITDLINKVQAMGGRVGCFPVSEKSWTDMGDWNEYLKVIGK